MTSYYRFFPFYVGIFFILLTAKPGFSTEAPGRAPGDRGDRDHGKGNTYELIADHGDTRKDASAVLGFLDKAEHIIRYQEWC